MLHDVRWHVYRVAGAHFLLAELYEALSDRLYIEPTARLEASLTAAIQVPGSLPLPPE